MKIQMVVFGVIAAAAGLFAGIDSAGAHARLKESTPKVGDVLQAPPSEVRITFTNDIQRIAGTYGIDVTDDAGASVTAAAAVIDEEDRAVMSVTLLPALPQGRYVVKYKNVSDADGDPFEAGFAFYVGVEPTDEQRAADDLLDPPDIAATQTFVARQTTIPAPDGGETLTPQASSTATPPADRDDGDGGGNSVVIVAIAAVVAGTVIGFFGVRWFAGRRA
jgi:methionine-rich copper-binding protein CopC